MPSAERSTFSSKQLAIRVVFPFLVGGLVGYMVARAMYVGSGSDRPPIVVSDGSIKVEEVDNLDGSIPPRGKGKFTSDSTGKSWKHEHDGKAPKRLHALVEGSDTTVASNCAALYFVQDITTATFTYRYTGGNRTVVVSRDGNDDVVFKVDQEADVQQTGGLHTLLIDTNSGADLASVTFAWGTGSSTPLTCQFANPSSPRITLLQTSK